MQSPRRSRPRLAAVHRAADGLRQIVQALRLSTHVLEKKHGVTGAQLFVLLQLSQADGLSLHELALRTRTDPSSVSVAVSRLHTRGFVRRKKDPADARRAVVSLTSKGAALLSRAPEPAQARLIGALEELPKGQLACLADALDVLARSMGVPSGTAPMFFEEDRARAT